jgi:hypothetical protein
MRCRVLKGFIDGNTGKGYNVGDVYECEKSRYDEIMGKGEYLLAIHKKHAEIAEKQAETAE